MLTLSKGYTKRFGNFDEGPGAAGNRELYGYGRAYFDVVAETDTELKAFWEENKTIIREPRYCSEIWCKPLENQYRLPLEERHREIATSLVYRANLFFIGEQFKADKKDFLEKSGFEAIKAIIYATNYCPEGLEIDDYARVVQTAFANHEASTAFDDRIINVAVLQKTRHQMGVVSRQIKLFKELLSLPLEEQNEIQEDDVFIGTN